MIGKYFTNWVHFALLIWYILYILNFKIYKYINLYYPSIIILIGYILLYLYYYNLILGYKFHKSLLIFQLFTHLSPLLLLLYLNQTKTQYSLITLFILIIIYLMYLKYIKKTIYQVYFVDTVPKNFNDIEEICISKEIDYFPITIKLLCNYIH